MQQNTCMIILQFLSFPRTTMYIQYSILILLYIFQSIWSFFNYYRRTLLCYHWTSAVTYSVKTADWSWGRVWVILVLCKNPLQKKPSNFLDYYIKMNTLKCIYHLPITLWAAKSFTTSFLSEFLVIFLSWLTYYNNALLLLL